VAGTYTLKVTVEQVWSDEVTGEPGLVSEDTMSFEVEGDSAKGCSAVPFGLGCPGPSASSA
jgi:hypothetical protein